MSDKQYATIAGVVPFAVDHKTLPSGTALREFVVESLRTGDHIRITAWPGLDAVAVNQGDFVVVKGEAKTESWTNKDGEQKTQKKIVAYSMLALPLTQSVRTDGPATTKTTAPAEDIPF